MHYDTIRLAAFLKEQPRYAADLLVDYVLEINEHAVYEAFCVRLPELVKSCQLGGEFEIFTCGCGVAGCAGIWDGVTVRHSLDEITWACPEPMAIKDESSEEFENGPKEFRCYRFDPEQYINAIDAGLREIKALAVSAPGPIEFPVYGSTLKDMLQLEPRIFSANYPSAERHLVARQIVVYAYHQLISANGIYFEVTDLHLPESLLSLYAAYLSLNQYPQTAEELPQFLKYLQAGRTFCRSLHQYLGRQTTVNFVYKPPGFLIPDTWEISETIR